MFYELWEAAAAAAAAACGTLNASAPGGAEQVACCRAATVVHRRGNSSDSVALPLSRGCSMVRRTSVVGMEICLFSALAACEAAAW